MKSLLAIRAGMNLSQIEAAKMIGISTGAYSNAERGKLISEKTASLIRIGFDIEPQLVKKILNVAPRRIKRPVV